MLIQAAEARSDPARHLALAVQTARENLAEARALVAALSPAPLDGSTLDEALVRLAPDRLREDMGMTVTFTVRGESRPLPPPIEVVLIRAAQEERRPWRTYARHAAASRVDVSVVYGPETVALEVRDDGCGSTRPPPADTACAACGAGWSRRAARCGCGVREGGNDADRRDGRVTFVIFPDNPPSSRQHAFHARLALNGWELLYLVTFLAALVFIFFDDTLGTAERVISVGLISGCLAAYLRFGRRAVGVGYRSWEGRTYVVLLIVLFTPVTIICPPTRYLLFALCAQCFMMLPMNRRKSP